MDGGGILFDTRDPVEVARIMDAVLDDPRVEDAIIQSQDAALERLHARDFGATLLRFVGETLNTPPRQAPEVSWDFWQQFDQFERLEELRQFRPAIYRALPARPGSAARDPGSAQFSTAVSIGSRTPAPRTPDPGALQE
jgi:hypothetical protein